MDCKLAESNIKLAYHVANKWRRRSGLPVEDCVSMCFEGLCLAAKNFKPEKGIKFSTFAVTCMDSVFFRRARDSNTGKRKGETVSFSAELADGEGTITLEDTLGASDDYSLFEEGILNLEGREKVIVDMRLKGYTQREIGKFLGISQTHIGRILNVIKKKILC